MLKKLSLLWLAGLLVFLAQAVEPAAFRFVESEPGRLTLYEHDNPVFTYNYGTISKEGVPEDRWRCCYLHPVWSPDGTIITDDFPADHLHHRGISWMWPVVEIEGKRYDIWLLRGIRPKFERWIRKETSAGGAILEVQNGWYVGDKKVVEERVLIRAYPTRNQLRQLEFQLTFTAMDKPVTLSGSPDGKGYGGFNIRFAPRQWTKIRTPASEDEPDSNLRRYPWAELIGQYSNGHVVRTRVVQAPDIPGYPNGWCLRHYGFLGICYPGLARHVLQPGKPLTLKATVEIEPVKFSGATEGTR